MEKIVFLSLLLALLPAVSSAERIQVVRNTEFLKNALTIREYNGVKQVHIQDIANICQGQLSWYQISGKVNLSLNNHQLVFYYRSKKARIDAKKITLTNPTTLNKTGLYIPLDFILSEKFAEVSDYRVKYDEGKNIFYFTSVTNAASPRVYFDEGYARINIELAEKLKYKFKRSKKNEYTVKFEGGKVIPEKLNYQNEYLKQIEIKRYYKEAKYVIKTGTVPVTVGCELEENPLQLSLNIVPRAGVEKPQKKEPEKVVYSSAAENAPVIEAPMKHFSKKDELNKLVTIVIDAGHGGEDPGAIGVNGTKEKELNLTVAKEVTRLLAEDNFNVLLTRTEDKFIPLRDRAKFANDNHAKLFVSIHHNASPDKPYMKGFEIYFLSEKATDKEAEAVAARENAVIKFETKISKKEEEKEQLLWSMRRNEFINDSSELCYFIKNDVLNSSELDNLGIKQAGFYVLRGTQMPAVLVECGFLTNQQEELRLASPKFQKLISDSIYSGIKKYVQNKKLASNENKENE